MNNEILMNQVQVCNLLDISYSTLVRQRLSSEMNFPKSKSIGKELLFSKCEIESQVEDKIAGR